MIYVLHQREEGPEGSSVMHLSPYVEKSVGLNKYESFHRSTVRFRPKPRLLKSIWIWANRPWSKGSKLQFPVIKANKIKQDRVTIRIRSKKSCLRRICFPCNSCGACGAFFSQNNLACSTYFSYKNLVCRAFDFSVLFGLQIHWYWKWFKCKYSVIATTQFIKKAMKKISDNKPFVKTNFMRYNLKLHNTNSIPKQFIRNNASLHVT